MVDLPLDRLLQIAEADRQKNEDAFQADRQADRSQEDDRRSARRDSGSIIRPAAQLLKTTQDTLDSLRQFIVDHHIITIPPSDPAR